MMTTNLHPTENTYLFLFYLFTTIIGSATTSILEQLYNSYTIV